MNKIVFGKQLTLENINLFEVVRTLIELNCNMEDNLTRLKYTLLK